MSLLTKHLYQFGVFAVDTDQRVLLREGKPVPLAPKVFETLLMLVENSGRIVSKDELMNRLWPDTFVEDANLTFNIQQLRRTLGDNARRPIYVETIARRGYRFIAAVTDIPSDRGTDREPGVRLESPDGQATEKQERREDIPAPNLHQQKDHSDSAVSLATGASGGAGSPVNKGTFALAATLAVVMAASGLVYLKFSDLSTRNPNENKSVDSASSVSRLRLEKLTVTGQTKHAAISPDGKYVAYTRAFGKNLGIWLRQLSTNTNVEIVPATALIYSLNFSNSGENLYFVRADPTLSLYRVPLLGGVPVKIIDNLESNFSFSSDDTRIVFVRPVNRNGQREYALVIAGSDGSNERTVLVETYPNIIDAPVWSPDNRSIICSYGYSERGGQDVSIIEVTVDGGTKRELSPERFFRIRKMAWLPHKSGLILCARKNLGDNNQLWRVSFPGMGIRQMTEGLSPYLELSIASNSDKAVASQATRISDIWAGGSREPRNLQRITQATDEFCWTPNGRLVYPSTASGNWDLWITQPNSTEQRQLTNDPAVDKTPAVTYDNRYVVFTSNRTGTFQLWRMNVDGSNQIQLTNGSSADHASISPDGKWVIYNTTEDWHMWRIPIEGGEPVRLVDHPAYFPAVSPDGKTIACLERNEPKSDFSIVIIAFEGGQHLKRIDFTGGGLSGTRIQWWPDGRALVYAADRIGPTALIKQSLDGGPPQEIVDFGADELFDFGYSSDGKFLAVTRGVWQHDMVLISDLNGD